MMLNPIPMRWLSALVLEQDLRTALRAVGELGAVQLAATAAGPESAPRNPPDRMRELTQCDQFLSRAAELRRVLNTPHASRDETSVVAMPLPQAEQHLAALERRAESLLARRQQLRHQWEEATAMGQRLDGFEGVELPLDQPEPFSFLHFVFGSLPQENLEKLEETLGRHAVVIPLPGRPGRTLVMAPGNGPSRTALDDALRQSGFHADALPVAANATAHSLLEASRLDAARIQTELTQANAAVDSLARDATRELPALEASVHAERLLWESEQLFPRTQATVLVTGWIPARDTPVLLECVQNVTGGRCAIDIAPPENVPEEQIPVLLHYARLLQPFATLVRGFGLPRYHELSPTLFVALSSLLMFGMMFGDVGHGAVLIAAGLLATLVSPAARRHGITLLLVSAGLASSLFGVIYGSYFGIASLKHYALWRDPLEGDPLALMRTAIGIGAAVISLGLVLNIVNHLRHREFVAACLDKFGIAGLWFYWGGLLLLTHYPMLQKSGLVPWALAVFGALPLVAWTLRHPLEHARRQRPGPSADHEGWFDVWAESLIGSFEGVLVFLANTVSFVRLAAYAMSHAALLMATWLLADAVRDHSAAGGGLALAIIILGNALAILLEGVIASVQTVRLEYYEFFSKFFSGNGRPFRPFRIAARGPVR
jgi:V/A-type H+/Na+-transporting ATPase subunit I